MTLNFQLLFNKNDNMNIFYCFISRYDVTSIFHAKKCHAVKFNRQFRTLVNILDMLN